ncbi:hypothetical protein KAH51_09300 [Proteus vulgaris]|uniref:hypothetical protein n=1 Tax=Proteus vulgaris TaxID=585 RepID=UPI001B36B8BD|nr:hypothetical protein [Proteus vulgaris]MBQ0213650.1 hypothetical protein [Proteus vulgaris]
MSKLKDLMTKQYSLKLLFFKYWLGGSAIIIFSSVILFYTVVVPLIQIEVFSLNIAIYFVAFALSIKTNNCKSIPSLSLPAHTFYI